MTHQSDPNALEIAPPAASQLTETADVLARAFCGNPVNRAVIRSDDRERSLRSNRHGMLTLISSALRHGRVLVANRAAAAVGALIATPPGRFPLPAPPVLDQLRFVFRQGWSIGRRWQVVFDHLDALHPDEPHWYLGVLGVDPAAQRCGVGAALLSHWLCEVDRDAVPAYLETDRADRLHFYERLGFAHAGETAVLGVRIWLMQRPPASRFRSN